MNCSWFCLRLLASYMEGPINSTRVVLSLPQHNFLKAEKYLMLMILTELELLKNHLLNVIDRHSKTLNKRVHYLSLSLSLTSL